MLRSILLVSLAAIAVVAALGLATAFYGAWRWRAETQELHARLDAARVAPRLARFERSELDGLPAPVQRYLRAVLRDGQPLAAAVRLAHSGTFNLSEKTEQWRPFTSEQLVITQRPGFDWNGRIAMLPGVPVRVHDAYIAGEGLLHASLFGVLTLANLRDDDELAAGELMRFLAEAAWVPTALLPGQGVSWEAVDERSARATLADGALRVTLLFNFGEDGLIDTVRADARGRTVQGKVVPTPWVGRFWNYADRDGMRVPLDGEVSWVLGDGPRAYWRGTITAIEYEWAR